MHHAEDHNSIEHNTSDKEESDTTGGDLIPFPRTSPEQDDTWITGRDWRVERVDTEPMTRQQHAAAVTALAALINQWLAERNNNGAQNGHNAA